MLDALRKTVRGSMVAAVMWVLLSFWSAAHAAEADVSAPATMAAIDQLKGLAAKIPQLVAAADRIYFGPFSFKGSCGFDYSWYCFGLPCQKENWTYKPDFGPGKAVVQRAYGNLNTVAGTFTAKFSATKAWLLTDVPAISTAFGAASEAVNADVKIYNDPGANPAQKSQAQADIIAQIQALLVKIDSAKSNLTAAITGVSSFAQNLSAAFTGITNAENSVNSMFAAAEAGVNRYPFHCGRPACLADLKLAEQTMRNQLGAVSSAAKAAGVDAGALDQQASLVLGSLVSLQQQTNGVLQNLKNAKITPPGAVQELRLAVAQKTWQQLATYAKEKL